MTCRKVATMASNSNSSQVYVHTFCMHIKNSSSNAWKLYRYVELFYPKTQTKTIFLNIKLISRFSVHYLRCNLQNRLQTALTFLSGASTLGQKSSIYPKIHILKISFFTKFTISIFKSSFFTKITFSKYHFWQKSHFQNIIFHKIHIHKTLFSHNSHFSNIKFSGISG